MLRASFREVLDEEPLFSQDSSISRDGKNVVSQERLSRLSMIEFDPSKQTGEARGGTLNLALRFMFPLLLLAVTPGLGCEKSAKVKEGDTTPNTASASATTTPAETTPQRDFGARDLTTLIVRAEKAILENDAATFGSLLAPETVIMEACGGAFPNAAARAKLGRSYMMMQARVAPAVEKCSKAFDWSKASRIGAEGGVLFATPPGCKPDVKRYVDVHVYYQLDKDIHRMILKNPVTFDDGKTWVLDREPECGRFVLALNKESLAKSSFEALRDGKQDALDLLSAPNRILEGSCENPPATLISDLRSLSRQPARQRSVRDCKELMGWSEGEEAPEFTYSEAKPVEGCTDPIREVEITATGKDGATLTMKTLSYHGGIGERWHLTAPPRCAKP